MRLSLAPFAALAALSVVLGVSSRADAHAVGLSRGDYALEGDTVSASLTFARGDALVLAPTLDADGDGAISESEVLHGPAALREGVLGRLSVQAGDAPCVPKSVDASLTQGDGITVRGTYQCPSEGPQAKLALGPLFDELPSGHRHMAHLVAADSEVVLFHGSSDVSLGQSASKALASGPARAGALQIFRMGVEHILTGYDHLLFLFGLVLVASRWKSLLPVVTAFTVAHSLTLGVAVLGLWTPPSRVVEPLSRSRTWASRTCSSRTPASAGGSRFRSASSTASASPARSTSWPSRAGPSPRLCSPSTSGSRQASSWSWL